jgi:hypothetical protein
VSCLVELGETKLLQHCAWRAASGGDTGDVGDRRMRRAARSEPVVICVIFNSEARDATGHRMSVGSARGYWPRSCRRERGLNCQFAIRDSESLLDLRAALFSAEGCRQGETRERVRQVPGKLAIETSIENFCEMKRGRSEAEEFAALQAERRALPIFSGLSSFSVLPPFQSFIHPRSTHTSEGGVAQRDLCASREPGARRNRLGENDAAAPVPDRGPALQGMRVRDAAATRGSCHGRHAHCAGAWRRGGKEKCGLLCSLRRTVRERRAHSRGDRRHAAARGNGRSDAFAIFCHFARRGARAIAGYRSAAESLETIANATRRKTALAIGDYERHAGPASFFGLLWIRPICRPLHRRYDSILPCFFPPFFVGSIHDHQGDSFRCIFFSRASRWKTWSTRPWPLF